VRQERTNNPFVQRLDANVLNSSPQAEMYGVGDAPHADSLAVADLVQRGREAVEIRTYGTRSSSGEQALRS
jgi:hypothetical protein